MAAAPLPARRDHDDDPLLAPRSVEQPMRSTLTAARFDPILDYDQWRSLGLKMARYATASAWWLGDWVVFGRDKYGRSYAEAVRETGLDGQTLRNYAVVARRFPPERRRAGLTLQHHAEVCALPPAEQDAWLDRAVEDRWSRNELRRRLRAARDGELGSGPPRLELPAARAARWRRAAEQHAVALEDWIVGTLDRAADAVLDDAMLTA